MAALEQHAVLVIDASAPVLHAGVWAGGGWAAIRRQEGDALETLFELVGGALQEASLPIDHLGGFIYCEGPGSLLGLRLSAMAVSTWMQLPALRGKPLWTYRSLAVAARQLEIQGVAAPFAVVSPFRRGLFNVLTVDGATNVLKAEELEGIEGRCFFIPQRHLPQVPPGLEVMEYDLEHLSEETHWDGLLRRADNPEPWVPEPLEFDKWSGERHR